MEEISYLTKAGADKLHAELEELKGTKREQLAKRLRTAIQQGDLSENADYISAKEEQGFLEGRILELERTLKNVVLIEETRTGYSVVDIGCRVIVQEQGEAPDLYFIVGPKEANPITGWISFESPIGKALMGHKPGDVVEIHTPGGVLRLTILKLE